LRMPLFVKPLRMDASIGIDAGSLVRSTREMMERVLLIHDKVKDAALAEEFVEGREFYVGVLGNAAPQAFPPIEMDFSAMPAGAPEHAERPARPAPARAARRPPHAQPQGAGPARDEARRPPGRGRRRDVTPDAVSRGPPVCPGPARRKPPPPGRGTRRPPPPRT